MRGPESEEKEIFSRLASEYLQRPACPRFLDGEDRLLFLRDLLIRNRIKGVIYHDLGFCDLTGYDYLLLKSFFQENNIPLLKLKTELGAGEIGQILTRVEAFLETIGEEVGP